MNGVQLIFILPIPFKTPLSIAGNCSSLQYLAPSLLEIHEDIGNNISGGKQNKRQRIIIKDNSETG